MFQNWAPGAGVFFTVYRLTNAHHTFPKLINKFEERVQEVFRVAAMWVLHCFGLESKIVLC